MNSDSPIRVGSDCSGWGSEVFALKMLGLNVDHRFACDVAQHSKTFIFNNCKPKVWYENCMIRNNQKTPSVDVYVAGFPCQPFSSAGKNKGLRDDRGTVFDGIYDYIRHQKPRIFVLENVKNLVSSKHKSTFHAILKLLGGLKCPENPKNTMYLLTWNIYNSKHFGVPQNRERLYIVGLRRSNIVKLDWVRHNKKFTDMMNQCVMETPDIRNFLGQLKEKLIKRLRTTSTCTFDQRLSTTLPKRTCAMPCRRSVLQDWTCRAPTLSSTWQMASRGRT
jgi:DNA-cytosine methyltransferase